MIRLRRNPQATQRNKHGWTEFHPSQLQDLVHHQQIENELGFYNGMLRVCDSSPGGQFIAVCGLSQISNLAWRSVNWQDCGLSSQILGYFPDKNHPSTTTDTAEYLQLDKSRWRYSPHVACTPRTSVVLPYFVVAKLG